MRNVFCIQVRKPIEFLSRLMTHIAGDIVMSMEGDLSRCSFDELEGCKTEPVQPLKKITLLATGRHDFIVVFLNETNRKKLIESILPRIGLRTHVWHIEIAQNGMKVFGSYDNFNPECVWLDKSLGNEIVQALLNEKIISNFELQELDI
jgi:hypothetical protein